MVTTTKQTTKTPYSQSSSCYVFPGAWMTGQCPQHFFENVTSGNDLGENTFIFAIIKVRIFVGYKTLD